MIRNPRTEVQVSPAETFSIECEVDDGETQAACLAAAENWFKYVADQRLTGASLENFPAKLKVKHVNRHCGLGSGTQLSFSIAVALQTILGLPIPSTSDLAQSLDRAARSAIGSYGFFQGGLLVDRGIESNQHVAELDFRGDFPEHWPVLIVSPTKQTSENIVSVSGNAERAAFANLAATSQTQRDEMISIIKEKIIPGVINEDFELFAESVTEFGRRSGQFFAAAQGGTYASSFGQQVVDEVLDVCVAAVGQSSWGPAMFVVAPSMAYGEVLKQHLEQTVENCNVEMTFADNEGVVVKHVE